MIFYNDNDAYCAQWLLNLIDAGHLPTGTVCERDIRNVLFTECTTYEQCHWFAGIGGWPYALALAGWPATRPVWTASCPCQPFSQAGQRRGTADARHLWPVLRDLIAECRPATLFGEQVASLAGRTWLAGVRADLEDLGYAVGAADLCAASAGAPHIRQRLFWVGIAHQSRLEGRTSQPGNDEAQQSSAQRAGSEPCGLGHLISNGVERAGRGRCQFDATSAASFWDAYDILSCRDGKTRRIEPGTFPLAHGVPARMGKLRAYGNAIVPHVAAVFVRAFLDAERDGALL